jgi:uncharacterized protein (UPF0548 family)
VSRQAITTRGQTARNAAAIMAEMVNATLTYPEVGAIGRGEQPSGYHHGSYVRILTGSNSAEVFRVAADGLRDWQAHRISGVEPIVAPPLLTGETGLFAYPAGPVEVSIACRIVQVVETPDQFGFSYGTLPLHPECGEERFLLTRVGNEVRFTIDVFWRSAHILSTLGGPITSLLQKRATNAYLDALQTYVSSTLAAR